MDSVPIERRTWMPEYIISIHAIMTILLCIRLVSRFQRYGGRPGLDDVFITLAWIVSTANAITTLLGTYSYGFDRHIWDIPPEEWPKLVLITWVVSMLYLFSTAFTKISVLLFYRRLVQGTCSRRYKYAIWAAMGFVIVYTFVFVVLLLVTCKPIQATWLRLDPTYSPTRYHCGSNDLMGKVSDLGGALSVVSDFYSVLLPAVLLLQIRITSRQRWGLMAIFSVGFLVVIAGIVRTYYLGKAEGSNPDKTWIAFNVFVAGIAEGNVAIICACAPSLKSFFGVFFRDHMPKLKLSALRSGGSDSKNKRSAETDMMETPNSGTSQLPVYVEKSWAVASSSADTQDDLGMHTTTSVRSEAAYQPTYQPTYQPSYQPDIQSAFPPHMETGTARPHSRLGTKDRAYWG